MRRPSKTVLLMLGLAMMFAPWADRLGYVGIAVEEPGYHVWGSSSVIGPDGKTHLFVASVANWNGGKDSYSCVFRVRKP